MTDSGVTCRLSGYTRLAAFAGICLGAVSPGLGASQLDIHGPVGSGSFGTYVAVLPNGNIVVTDPDYSSATASGIGAVYLYSPTGTLISTLTGATAGDQITRGGNPAAGIVVLKNGNYLILSPKWSNGGATAVGAVTWASETAGVSGVVSADNSLVGGSAVTALANGNYVVISQTLIGGVPTPVATWANGATGITGVVSSSNSLISPPGTDPQAGFYAAALTNGNYVVVSRQFPDESTAVIGAATWCNGATGLIGTVSSSNSLIGSSSGGGIENVTALKNGNYVVTSSGWTGGPAGAGAVTWGDGFNGTTGIVSESNSLVGTEANDEIGVTGIWPLTNGNYVVDSAIWHGNLGAVTWGNGLGGTVGPVSASNSLVGSSPNDQVGGDYINVLANGNYVVQSRNWTNGSVVNAGAATWGDGSVGTSGVVSPSNSLVGSSTNDSVGFALPLSNGNYVVASYSWSSPTTTSVGAVTWGNGTTGISGLVSMQNSLTGSSPNDGVGLHVVALRNGNYVVGSPAFSTAAATNVGAATWGDGTKPTVGVVSPTNSLLGSSAGDNVGQALTALSNGNYVVTSPLWSNQNILNVGAVTWGDGDAGVVGVVSPGNSLVGSTSNDLIGKFFNGVEEFSTSGFGAIPTANGNYVVRSSLWQNDGVTAAGAISIVHGAGAFADSVNASNSVLGTVASGGYSMVHDYDAARDQLVVGRPIENTVTLFVVDELFRNGFE